ncbi:clustered mitochondria protein homolog isoform X2 [Petromyzon marinus]|uniref:clustered mitochondria protein homolog isoform X2 n=1 Tax=Petromyzon marinus TaxID=7757 RepID=UPI003F6F5913
MPLADGDVGVAGGGLGVATDPAGVATDLAGVAGGGLGVATDPAGVATDLAGVACGGLGVATDPAGVATDLAGVACGGLGVATDPAGVATDPAGVATDPAGVANGEGGRADAVGGARGAVGVAGPDGGVAGPEGGVAGPDGGVASGEGAVSRTGEASARQGERDGERDGERAGERDGELDGERDGERDGEELVVIQETGFNVNVLAPGMETFQVQVCPQELVQEVVQLLMDRADCCHRTCFSLRLRGETLDPFAEVRSIPGFTAGATISVVEEAYTAREARIHVRHVRDLLQVPSVTSDVESPSFLRSVLGNRLYEPSGTLSPRVSKHPESVDLIPLPPPHILPGSGDVSLSSLTHIAASQDSPPAVRCLRVLTLSDWNPPPGTRRLRGDLLYLSVTTEEGRQQGITACPRGFYLNQYAPLTSP